MAYTEFPLQFKRQYAASLDKDSVFATNTEMQAYLSDPVRHAGQIVSCGEFPDKIYILNQERDAWNEVSGGGGVGSGHIIQSDYIDTVVRGKLNFTGYLSTRTSVLINAA